MKKKNSLKTKYVFTKSKFEKPIKVAHCPCSLSHYAVLVQKTAWLHAPLMQSTRRIRLKRTFQYDVIGCLFVTWLWIANKVQHWAKLQTNFRLHSMHCSNAHNNTIIMKTKHINKPKHFTHCGHHVLLNLYFNKWKKSKIRYQILATVAGAVASNGAGAIMAAVGASAIIAAARAITINTAKITATILHKHCQKDAAKRKQDQPSSFNFESSFRNELIKQKTLTWTAWYKAGHGWHYWVYCHQWCWGWLRCQKTAWPHAINQEDRVEVYVSLQCDWMYVCHMKLDSQ